MRPSVELRNLRNDWRRWSIGERVTALAIVATSLMSSVLLVLTGP